jgi:hypothetical protein
MLQLFFCHSLGASYRIFLLAERNFISYMTPHLSFQQKNHNVRQSLGETTKTQEKNSIPVTEI